MDAASITPTRESRPFPRGGSGGEPTAADTLRATLLLLQLRARLEKHNQGEAVAREVAGS